jgi:Flp pilus assembly protein TadG
VNTSFARWLTARLGDRERGNAVIEFVFLAVLVLIPLVYFVVAVAAVQGSTLAVTQAAREAGRAFATADTEEDAIGRAQVAVRLALGDQGLRDDAQLRYVPVGADCLGTQIVPVLAPGAEFEVCVVRHCDVPAIPTVLQGKGITSVGRYELHIDDYRTVAP